MPRASCCFLPAYVWHITHCCHKKEFKESEAEYGPISEG